MWLPEVALLRVCGFGMGSGVAEEINGEKCLYPHPRPPTPYIDPAGAYQAIGSTQSISTPCKDHYLAVGGGSVNCHANHTSSCEWNLL